MDKYSEDKWTNIVRKRPKFLYLKEESLTGNQLMTSVSAACRGEIRGCDLPRPAGLADHARVPNLPLDHNGIIRLNTDKCYVMLWVAYEKD